MSTPPTKPKCKMRQITVLPVSWFAAFVVDVVVAVVFSIWCCCCCCWWGFLGFFSTVSDPSSFTSVAPNLWTLEELSVSLCLSLSRCCFLLLHPFVVGGSTQKTKKNRKLWGMFMTHFSLLLCFVCVFFGLLNFLSFFLFSFFLWICFFFPPFFTYTIGFLGGGGA